MNNAFRMGLIIATAVALIHAPATVSQTKQATPPAGAAKPKVTFVELGSVKCVPCKMMQPVMASIEKRYGDQIEIVFHDVWTDSGRSLAEPYKIRAIPTQVFLDARGVEFHRHEGFYPEAEIDKILQKQGLKTPAPVK